MLDVVSPILARLNRHGRAVFHDRARLRHRIASAPSSSIARNGRMVGSARVRLSHRARAACSSIRAIRTSRARIPPTISPACRRRCPRRLRRPTQDPDSRADRVIGIGVDTTGSTPIPVDAQRAAARARSDNGATISAAHAWLWKDHTGADEAAAITETARRARARVPRRHRRHVLIRMVLVEDLALPESRARRVRRRRELGRARRLPAGGARGRDDRRTTSGAVSAPPATRRCTRRRGAACRPKRFLTRLDPKLASLRARLYDKAWPSDRPAGESVRRNGPRRSACREGIPIAMGAFDAHYGAVGAGVATGTLVKIIGTSTCDIAIAPATGAASRRPRHLRHRERLGDAGVSTASRRGSPPSAICCAGGSRSCARATRRARAAVDGRRASSRPASRASSRSTGTTATAPSSWTRASPASSSARRCTRRARRSIAR